MRALTVRSPLAPLLVLLGHVVAVAILSRIDVISQLLGSARPNPVWLFLALAFYALRLVAVFVAPGWLFVTVGAALCARWSARRADG